MDRVGKRLIAGGGGLERTVKPVNGAEEPSKKAIDSTRVPADLLVDELLESTQLVDPSTVVDPDSKGLQLFVGLDGSATFGSAQHKPNSTFAVRTNFIDSNSNSVKTPVQSRSHRN